MVLFCGFSVSTTSTIATCVGCLFTLVAFWCGCSILAALYHPLQTTETSRGNTEEIHQFVRHLFLTKKQMHKYILNSYIFSVWTKVYTDYILDLATEINRCGTTNEEKWLVNDQRRFFAGSNVLLPSTEVCNEGSGSGWWGERVFVYVWNPNILIFHTTHFT